MLVFYSIKFCDPANLRSEAVPILNSSCCQSEAARPLGATIEEAYMPIDTTKMEAFYLRKPSNRIFLSVDRVPQAFARVG